MSIQSQIRQAFIARQTALQNGAVTTQLSADTKSTLLNAVHTATATHTANNPLINALAAMAQTPAIQQHHTPSFWSTYWKWTFLDRLINGPRTTHVHVHTTPNSATTNNTKEQNGSALVAMFALGTLMLVFALDAAILERAYKKLCQKMTDPFRKPADLLKLLAAFGGAYLGAIGGASAGIYYFGAFANPLFVSVVCGVAAAVLGGGAFYAIGKQCIRLANWLMHGTTNSTGHLPNNAMLSAPALANCNPQYVGEVLAEIAAVIATEPGLTAQSAKYFIRNPQYATQVASLAMERATASQTTPSTFASIPTGA